MVYNIGMNNNLIDNLIEFKPRRLNAIYAVRNGSLVAYVVDNSEPKGDWEKRYTVDITNKLGRFTSNFEEAKEWARQGVSGKAFRNFINRFP
mgnify:CR=1 FL=1